MTSSNQNLIAQLLGNIYTTSQLKQISDALEELAQNKAFKNHATDIVTDESLTDSQKKTQLSYLIKSIDIPTLQDFFSDILAKNTFWVFSSDKIDYFDKFVQEFQMATEAIGVIYLVTATKLLPHDHRAIAKDLSQSFGYKVVLNHQINPAIIGGAQVRVENLVFDFSLRNKFNQFERQWLSSLEKTDKLIGHHEQ
jgi:F0F1-type ATP synthase delta subunit